MTRPRSAASAAQPLAGAVPDVSAGLYLAVTGLLALGLGALIRRTAGAIAAHGVVLVLPVFIQRPALLLAGRHHPLPALGRRAGRRLPY